MSQVDLERATETKVPDSTQAMRDYREQLATEGVDEVWLEENSRRMVAPGWPIREMHLSCIDFEEAVPRTVEGRGIVYYKSDKLHT